MSRLCGHKKVEIVVCGIFFFFCSFRMRTRCGSSCTGSSSMSEDALGCRPSVSLATSGPNSVLRSQLPVTEGGGVHPLSVHHSQNGNNTVTLGASPSGKSVGLPSLASLIPSDSSRDVYLQRAQVSCVLIVFAVQFLSFLLSAVSNLAVSVFHIAYS